MTRYSEVFFESYNMSVEAAYEAYMKIVGDEYPREGAGVENKLNIYLKNEYVKWLDTPLDKLDGKTPAEYMESIDSLDNLMVMFNNGAVICDEGLPEIYLQKLKNHGENAIDALIKLALQRKVNNNDDAFLAPLTAVKVLGLWRVEKAIEPLIGMLDAEGEMFDLMYESIKDALVNIGYPALDSISTSMGSGRHSQTVDEYLLMAYTDIGKKNRADTIYTRLKKAFTDMPEKLIAASCLGDYGDGRAVPVLRGYITRNAHVLSTETCYEIISAVKKLGGRIDDLKFKN